MDTQYSTWIVKRKENMVLIELYHKDLLNPKYDEESKYKMFDEIMRLEKQNEWIENLTQLERRQDDLSSISIIESRINLTTNDKLKTA